MTVVVAYLSHFRAPFFQALRSAFDARDIDLELLYGVTDGHFSRALDWAEPFPVRTLPGSATWFPVLSRVAGGTDLAVVEDASRHLINYALLALRQLGGPKLVLWGHGWNHQTSQPDSLPERVKRQVGRRADGFLAYTAHIRAELIRRGYDGRRVHVVPNTVPRPAAADPHDAERLRQRLELAPEAQIALYCGRMYPMKRVELLIEAAVRVKHELPRFELILAGAGPTQRVAERAAALHSFIHFVGPTFDGVKAACFALSDVCVIPGVVGLTIVDAFQHGVPPIVTRMPTHGPEIDYLHHEINGLETRHDAADLANGIGRLLRDDALRRRLIAGCRTSSAELSLERMVEGFVEGVLSALGEEVARRRPSRTAGRSPLQRSHAASLPGASEPADGRHAAERAFVRDLRILYRAYKEALWAARALYLGRVRRREPLLPYGRQSPVIYIKDWPRNCYTDDYAMALASSGRIRLVGIATSSSVAPYNPWVTPADYERFVTERSRSVELARASGLRNIPDPVRGPKVHLEKPPSGRIEDTTPLDSEGTRLIVESARRATARDPLVVVVCTGLTIAADAYLLDPGIAERVVVAWLGGHENDMADYDGWSDGWAAYIALSKLRLVQFPPFRCDPRVPRSRLWELPATPLRGWMIDKALPDDQGYGRDGDAPPLVSLVRPDYVLETRRVSFGGWMRKAGHEVPVLKADRGGSALVVTCADKRIATEAWWTAMQDPRTYAASYEDTEETEAARRRH